MENNSRCLSYQSVYFIHYLLKSIPPSHVPLPRDVTRHLQGIHRSNKVFREQIPGFEDTSKPHHVYKLNKALYRLKQASRASYDRLS